MGYIHEYSALEWYIYILRLLQLKVTRCNISGALLYRDNLGALVLDMLFHWARGQRTAGPGAVSRLMDAMMESGRKDLAEEIEDIVNLGRQKYSDSLRRVGLEGEGSSQGETQQ